MSAHIVVSGKLISEPKRIETKTGTLMVTALLAVPTDVRGEALDGDWLVSVTAFGDLAERLLQALKLDQIAASGVVQRQLWSGEVRFGLVADSISSSRAARDASRRRHAAASGGG